MKVYNHKLQRKNIYQKKNLYYIILFKSITGHYLKKVQ